QPVQATIDTLPVTDPSILAEDSREEKKKKLTAAQLQLATRPKDHLLIQVGYDNWARKPDTLNTRGFSRSFNMYFMFDFPFKTNPQLSVAVGAGISTSNIISKTPILILPAGTLTGSASRMCRIPRISRSTS